MDHVVYINLDHRTDRREHVEKELAALGITHAVRFPAVFLSKNPAAGCSISHLKCLEKAKAEGWPHVLIMEDDIVFQDVPMFRRLFDGFIVSEAKQNSFDVLLIAGNNMLPYLPHNAFSIQVLNCQTTTGYLVKAHYYDTMIENIREGVKGLLKDPTNKATYAIDKFWLPLQRKDRWFLLVPLSVYQLDGYSDIEEKQVSFRHYMLDVNKAIKP